MFLGHFVYSIIVVHFMEHLGFSFQNSPTFVIMLY